MHLKPPPGAVYRDTRTRELVPPEGRDFDPNDLDVVRALADGDLIPVSAAPAKGPAKIQE